MSRAKRPERTYETGPVTLWLRRVAVVATVALTVVLLARYPYLPETIPTHFSFTGEADDWGPRWMLFPLITVFTVLVFVTAWISTRPQIFNYPMGITEANAQSAYREGERMMVWTAISIVPLYAGAAVSTFGGPGGFAIAAGLVCMLGAVIAGLVRLLAVQ